MVKVFQSSIKTSDWND